MARIVKFGFDPFVNDITGNVTINKQIILQVTCNSFNIKTKDSNFFFFDGYFVCQKI